MDALNYLKLDLKLLKGYVKIYIFIVFAFMIAACVTKSINMGIGYLFFILILLAGLPFSIESNDKCKKMYYMFPAKLSSMVLGRFLYLFCINLLTWAVCGGIIYYNVFINKMDDLVLSTILLIGIIASLIGFLQYPFYYKFGMEKGRILSSLLYTIPAFLVFSLPSIMGKIKINVSIDMIIAVAGLIAVILGVIAYKVSCVICENKEL